MPISQIFNNRSKTQDYSPIDMATNIGISGKELTVLTDYARGISLVARTKSNPQDFIDIMKTINSDAKSFFSKLDPTSINKQISDIARNVGKIDPLFKNQIITSKGIKIIYKSVQNIIDNLVKIVRDITTNNSMNLSKEASVIFVEMKVTLKYLVEGLQKLKLFAIKNLSTNLDDLSTNVDNLKIKIKSDSNKVKKEIQIMKDNAKKDVELVAKEFKKDSKKITEWFKKVFLELDKKVVTVATNKAKSTNDKVIYRDDKLNDKTLKLKVSPDSKHNKLDDTSQSKNSGNVISEKVPIVKKQYAQSEEKHPNKVTQSSDKQENKKLIKFEELYGNKPDKPNAPTAHKPLKLDLEAMQKKMKDAHKQERENFSKEIEGPSKILGNELNHDLSNSHPSPLVRDYDNTSAE